MVTIALVAPALYYPTAADAQECGPEAPTINARGANVEGFCFGYSPGRQPSSEGLSAAQRWAVFCESRSFPSFADGYTVTIDFLSEADRDQVIDRGLDPTGTYGIYLVNCNTFGEANAGNFGYTVAWELTAPVPVTVLRDRAAARIRPPDPAVASNPPLDEPGRFGIVHIPTWLWIDDSWEPIGPEVETSGLITVEVIASPRHVSWEMGEGRDPEICEGPGVPWAPSMPEDGTYCSYTYSSSSADLPSERYELSATVEWYFEWWINGAPQGEFDAYDATTAFTYQVGEIQAIESN